MTGTFEVPVTCLVQKRDLLGAGFAVGGDAVPEGEDDGRVVGVTHATAGVHFRVAAHGPPLGVGRGGVAGDQAAILRLADPVRGAAADVDRLPTGAEEFLHHVRFASAQLQGFIPQNEAVCGRGEVRLGDEKPFPLADEAGVVAFVPFLATDVFPHLGEAGDGGFERFHRAIHIHGGGLHRGDEPVPFIVAAQEFFVAPHIFPFEQEEQVAQVGADVERGEFDGGQDIFADGDLEDFRAVFLYHIQGEFRGGNGPTGVLAGRDEVDFQVRPDAGKVPG